MSAIDQRPQGLPRRTRPLTGRRKRVGTPGTISDQPLVFHGDVKSGRHPRVILRSLIGSFGVVSNAPVTGSKKEFAICVNDGRRQMSSIAGPSTALLKVTVATLSDTNTSRSRISIIRAPKPRALKPTASASASTRLCSISSTVSPFARRRIVQSTSCRPIWIAGSRNTMRRGHIRAVGASEKRRCKHSWMLPHLKNCAILLA
jgi:hypothetical protein